MNPQTNLLEAQQFVEDHKAEGAECPCCHQFVKLYKRKLSSSMTYVLLLIQRRTDDWLHVEDYLKSLSEIPASVRGDFPKLRHWGLIEKSEGRREDGNPCNGLYRITAKGKLFARGQLAVPRYCFIFNDEVDGFSTESVSVQEALADKFNYSELMPSQIDVRQQDFFAA